MENCGDNRSWEKLPQMEIQIMSITTHILAVLCFGIHNHLGCYVASILAMH